MARLLPHLETGMALPWIYVGAPPDSAVKTVGVDGGFNVYKISNVAVVAAVVGPEGDDGRVMKGALLDGEKSFLPG